MLIFCMFYSPHGSKGFDQLAGADWSNCRRYFGFIGMSGQGIWVLVWVLALRDGHYERSGRWLVLKVI